VTKPKCSIQNDMPGQGVKSYRYVFFDIARRTGHP